MTRAAAPATIAPLAPLDLIAHVMDSPERPLDFTLILRLAGGLPTARLHAGAASARRLFPVSACRIEGRRWVLADDDDANGAGPAIARVAGPAEIDARLRAFVAAPFDLRRDVPVRQLALDGGAAGGLTLATRFHHAACDGAAACLWIAHQLAVAVGARPAVETRQPFRPPALRAHPRPVRRSRFAFRLPAERLATRPGPPGRARGWHAFTVPAPGPSGRASATQRLAACWLEALGRWARRTGAGRGRRLGLWIPVDIRRRAGGFGNGTSRIRAYDRGRGQPAVQRQMAWSLRHGEWAIPAEPALLRWPLPTAILAPALRAYFRRPWVDMGSAGFTYVERPPFDGQPWTAAAPIDDAIAVAPLDRRHALSLAGLAVGGRAHLTITYDPALVSPDDARALADDVGAALGGDAERTAA